MARLGPHWERYEAADVLLAGLATPLVLSVHTVASFEFAIGIIHGWHATIFPPYFVAGAIFGGFAMVMLLIVPCREWFGLKEIITPRHLENMAKIILATGMMVGYAYAMEFFISWYSGNPTEMFVFINRAAGPYAWAYWTMVVCNVVVPQVFWSRKARSSPWVIFGVAALVNVGMWFERFVIIVSSLHGDFLPSSWGMFTPTYVDVLTFAGTFGIFFTLFLLFVPSCSRGRAWRTSNRSTRGPAGFCRTPGSSKRARRRSSATAKVTCSRNAGPIRNGHGSCSTTR